MSFFGPPIRNGVPIGLGSSIGFGSAPFTPAELFYAGEQGFWYDPTDIPLAWRRNLLTYTEQFDNAAWTKTNATVTANSAVAPDGTTTADKLVSAAATAHERAEQSVTITASTAYTLTAYAKADGANFLGFRVAQDGGPSVWFDLVNGTVGTVESGWSAATITAAGDGWYRCKATYTTVGTSYTFRLFLAESNGSTIFTGDGVKGLFLWGAQLELGSTASTYQQIVTPEISFLQYQSQPVLYTTSDGTTPVTAVEQAVGLMLDKSKGLVLGASIADGPNTGTFTAGGTTLPTVNGNDTYLGLACRSVTFTSGVSGYGGSRATGASFSVPATNVYLATYQIALSRPLTGGESIRVYVTGSIGFGEVYLISSSPAQTSWNTYSRYKIDGVAAATEFLTVFPETNLSSPITVYVRGFQVQQAFGNHAFQTTSAKRPVLRARYNLLTYSEDQANAAWTKNGITATLSGSTNPNGRTVYSLVENTAASQHVLRQDIAVGATSHIARAVVKAAGRRYLSVYPQGAATAWAVFDLQTGTVFVTGGANYTASSITALGNGWFQINLTFAVPTAGTLATHLYLSNSGSSSPIYTGDGVSGVLVSEYDLRPASQATGLIGPTYQRIAAATDYDVVGYLSYLAFDGVDDALTTNSIDFSATDKVTLFAGVRKLSDAALTMVAELSADSGANSGTFFLAAPRNAATGDYGWRSRGTVTANATSLANYAAPISNVLTGIGDIAAPLAELRVNGTQAASVTFSQGTGNYGNHALFIGARNQTSLYFNGEIYSLIGRGAATTAGQIAATEQWVAVRTGVQL